MRLGEDSNRAENEEQQSCDWFVSHVNTIIVTASIIIVCSFDLQTELFSW